MKTLFNRFYYGKRVFVTGHTGFKGSWLTHWMQNLGATVHGYSDAVNANGIGNIDFQPRNVRDRVILLSELTAFQPDIVFHLAAQPLVSVSHMSPLLTFETNIMGTANLLDALRYMDFKGRIMVVTSDKVYAANDAPRREDDRLGGKDPYSVSKACAEMVADAYRLTDMDITTLRAGNVIGGGDWSRDRIVPDCVRALKQNIPIILRNPDATRPFQYVLDCLSGYLAAGAAKNCPTALNFGPNDSHSVRDLVNSFISAWGSGEWMTGSQRFTESQTLAVDSTLAQQTLGWSPVLTFEESVQETARWYAGDTSGQLEWYVDRATERKATWTQDWLNDLTP